MNSLKDIIPFENKAYTERTPLLLKMVYPKTKKQKKLLLKDRDINKYIRSHDFYDGDEDGVRKWLELGKKLIYILHDFHTGKSNYLSLIDSRGDLREMFPEIQGRSIINSYNRDKTRRHIYTQSIVNGIPVFRFYVFNIDYLYDDDPNRKIQGFYETHRIWYEDGKFWQEAREGGVKPFKAAYRDSVYHYKYMLIGDEINFYNIMPELALSPFYHMGMGVNNHDYRLLNGESVRYVYNFMKGEKEYKYFPKLPKNFNRSLKMSFIQFYNTMSRTPKTKINKNVPTEIKEHLLNNLVCTCEKERKALEYRRASKLTNDCYNYKNNLLVMLTINENLCVYRYYYLGVEYARIYFTPTKMFKFLFDFKSYSWVSTKTCIIFDSPMKTINKLKSNKTILNRINFQSFNSKYTSCLTYWCLRNVVFEQLSKMGRNDILDSFVDSCGPIWYYVNNDTTKKIKSAKSVSDLLSFSAKNLKFIDKISYNQLLWLSVNYKKISKQYFGEDVVLTLKAIEAANYDLDTIKKVRMVYRGDYKGFYNFFRVLVNRKYPQSELSEYIDYCRMVPDANRFARHHFSKKIKPKDISIFHRRVITDYNAYQGCKRQIEDKELNKKFKKVVKQDIYKQFLCEDDNFTIISPKCPNDLIVEGAMLSHCVGSYRHKMANGQSFIYFIRRKECIDEAYYTMEIVPKSKNIQSEKSTYDYDIAQIFGEHDKTIDNDELRNFIEAFKEKFPIIKEYGYMKWTGQNYFDR